MVKYVIIHNKHEGCYDFQCYEDHENKRKLTSITINPPKIFMFDDKEQAQDFFNDYINEVDVIDLNCKNGEDIEHVDYCTCGIVDLDDDDNPILFYNKRNQIFFMECGGQMFLPPQNTKNNIEDMNLTNRLIRKCRRLDVEQKQKYIELGKVCEDSMKESESEKEKEKEKEDEKPEQTTQPIKVEIKPIETKTKQEEPKKEVKTKKASKPKKEAKSKS
jgi:hypothetical protein